MLSLTSAMNYDRAGIPEAFRVAADDFVAAPN